MESEVNVKISLDGRVGLMEIQDEPYRFGSIDAGRDYIRNWYQNMLNFHTERYPSVCRDFVKKKGNENAEYISLTITGGIFGDTTTTVRSRIGGPNEEQGATNTNTV